MVEYQVMLNSSAVAQQIARGLASSGVTEVVIAPGSRSAPLIYALAPLAEAGIIRTHVRIDERDAGFLALGLARGLRARGVGHDASDAAQIPGAAVAVVTTSGSAVANLHPAILEASYGHLPLIAITADRPARLRGTGANQTIDNQAQVLSDVRARFDVSAGGTGADRLLAEAVARSQGEAFVRSSGEDRGTGGAPAGPVQFNVQFDTPLVPTESELAAWTVESAAIADRNPISGAAGTGTDDGAPTISLPLSSGTVIVAGDAGGRSAQQLRALAEKHSLPILAEPSSTLSLNAHNSSAYVPAHARVLSDRPNLRAAISTVIVHGKPTLTRPIAALLAEDSVQVEYLPDDLDAVILAAQEDSSSPDDSGDRSTGTTWCETWVVAGREIVAAARSEVSFARAVTERLAASPINLFVASSNAIRYLSEVTEVHAHIHASRGLAGIDGLVATATGLSLSLGEQVVLLIGDTAMLHDVGGLLTPSAEEPGDVVIVVLNDDGGAIFSGLEHSQDHLAPYLERYFTVPHGRGFEELATAYGWDYTRAGDLAEFEAAFTAGNSQDAHTAPDLGSRRLIEVSLPGQPVSLRT